MREIKFRAWCVERSERIKPNIYRYFDFDSYSEDRDSEYGEGKIRLDRKETVVEQFTGLKDKNGKEIYEGDILALDTTPILSIVKWNDSMAGFEINNHGSNQKVEVIGNVHESPELLK